MKRSLILALLLIAAIASAQDRWSMGFRVGPSLATKDFDAASLNTGFGFEGTLAYQLLPELSAYAGWGWNRFPADPSATGQKLDFEETGYTFGLQYGNSIGESSLAYRIGAGAVLNHVEVENSDGDNVADTRHGLGWQVETGLEIPISSSLRVAPTVRYRSLARDITIGGTTTAADLNYVSVGVGFAWAL